MSAPTRLTVVGREGGRGPKSSAEVSARKPESGSKKPAERRPWTSASGPGCAPKAPGSMMSTAPPASPIRSRTRSASPSVSAAMSTGAAGDGDDADRGRQVPLRRCAARGPSGPCVARGPVAAHPRRVLARSSAPPGTPASRHPSRSREWRVSTIIRPGGGNPAASRPSSPSATMRCAGSSENREGPAAGSNAGNSRSVRLVAVGALRPDVEGAQRHHAAFFVFDPDRVLRGGREDIDPALPHGELAGVRHDVNTPVPHLGEQLREKLRFDLAPDMQVDRTGDQRLRRRKPVHAQPRDPRRRPRHPRRRFA